MLCPHCFDEPISTPRFLQRPLPILDKERDIFPRDLFQDPTVWDDPRRQWYCMYTLSRREKDLMRRLAAIKIPFFSPIVPKRYRSPSGRLRTSYALLFPNYVFVLASDEQRQDCLATQCISRQQIVADRRQLVMDLRQIHKAVLKGVPLTPESRLESGQRVRVRSGPFQGFEGQVIRRAGKTRLLLAINFLEQGVSMEMDEAVIAPL